MAETIYIVDPLPDERRRIVDALANEPVHVEWYDDAAEFLDQVAATRSGCVLHARFIGDADSSTTRAIAVERATSVVGVRRAKAALSSGCKPHPATAPAGSNRSSHGGNEVAEAFD